MRLLLIVLLSVFSIGFLLGQNSYQKILFKGSPGYFFPDYQTEYIVRQLKLDSAIIASKNRDILKRDSLFLDVARLNLRKDTEIHRQTELIDSLNAQINSLVLNGIETDRLHAQELSSCKNQLRIERVKSKWSKVMNYGWGIFKVKNISVFVAGFMTYHYGSKLAN